MKLKVVGIVQKPAVLAAHIQSVYVPLATLQKFLFPGKPAGVNKVMIDLNSKASLDGFVGRWRPRLAQMDPDLSLQLGRDVRDKLDQNLQGVHLMSYLGGTVAMLAATFIIFSALSMGVTERSRTLAMLRAVGAARGQVARVVVLEGVLLAGAGVVVGVPLGYVWLFLVHLRFKEAIAAGLTLSWAAWRSRPSRRPGRPWRPACCRRGGRPAWTRWKRWARRPRRPSAAAGRSSLPPSA